MTRVLLVYIGTLALGAAFCVQAQEPSTSVTPEAYRRAVKADAIYIQKTIETIASGPDKHKGLVRSSKAVAMWVVNYAGRLGDDDLKTQAIRLARAIDQEKWDEAGAAARQLAKPKAADPEVLKMALPKLTAAEIGVPFRSEKVGGLNIDRDILNLHFPRLHT